LFSYTLGTILKTDLTSGEITRESINTFSRSILGRGGIHIKRLHENISPGVYPVVQRNPEILTLENKTNTNPCDG
jgi:aldehyde:ferredoxin oxidoreductase